MISSEPRASAASAVAIDARHQARLIGPAAAMALSRPGSALRVHSVFPSTLNLQVQGSELLIAISGPNGAAYPHAVVLESPEDFSAWGLPIGSRGRVGLGALHLEDPSAGSVTIDLSQAIRPAPQGIALIGRLTASYGACVIRLAELQAGLKCELRLGQGFGAGRATTVLGRRLRSAALSLGEAAALALSGTPRDSRWAERATPLLQRAVAALVGLGPGLTPSGDDFLCGLMAAVRACGWVSPQVRRNGVVLLNGAVADNLGATGEVSASLLRSAMQDCWPVPLVDLAQALADEREPEALAALADLCRLGHTSGADIATGFLFGLDVLAAEPRASPRDPEILPTERSAHGS